MPKETAEALENYVAWCRFTKYGPIVTCDSDAPGAFRVYRHPTTPKNIDLRLLAGKIHWLAQTHGVEKIDEILSAYLIDAMPLDQPAEDQVCRTKGTGFCAICSSCGGCTKRHIHCRKCDCHGTGRGRKDKV